MPNTLTHRGGPVEIGRGVWIRGEWDVPPHGHGDHLCLQTTDISRQRIRLTLEMNGKAPSYLSVSLDSIDSGAGADAGPGAGSNSRSSNPSCSVVH
jgi:hypothetical protein